MSGFVSRWAVAQRHDVDQADLGDRGVRTDVFERWISSASAAYLERCTVLRHIATAGGLTVRSRIAVVPDLSALGLPTNVVVSAGVTEVRPRAFTMAIRVRSFGGTEDGLVNAACEITLEGPSGDACEIDDAVRDELIALEHSARHTN